MLILSAVVEHAFEHLETFRKVGVAVCPDSLVRFTKEGTVAVKSLPKGALLEVDVVAEKL